MYESPIIRRLKTIERQINKDDDNNLMAVIRQTVEYDIDKEELIKALKYDRDSYSNGYSEGYFNGYNRCVFDILQQISRIDDGFNMEIYTNEVRQMIADLHPEQRTGVKDGGDLDVLLDHFKQ